MAVPAVTLSTQDNAKLLQQLKSGLKRSINWNKFQKTPQNASKLNFYDLPIKNDTKTYDNIHKITTGQEDDYATGCLLDYNYFKNYYKMIAKDLSKQPALDADLEVIQQVSFVQNLSGNINRLMFFIIEEAKETIHKEPKVL